MSTEIANPKAPTELTFGQRIAMISSTAITQRLGAEYAATTEGRAKIARAATMMENIVATAVNAASRAKSDAEYDKMLQPWWDLTPADWARAVKTLVDLDLNPVGAVKEVYAFIERGILEIKITPAGFAKLAARAGQIVTFVTVRMGDAFDYYQDEAGLHFLHRPVFTGDTARSLRPMVAVAVVIRRATDGRLINAVVLDMDQIAKRKAQSKLGVDNKGPWGQWFEEMAKKSVLHRALAEGAIVLDLGLEHALSVGAGDYDREVYDMNAEDEPRTRILQPPPAPALAAPPPTIERTRPAAPPMYTADGDDGESYADPPSNG